MLRVGREKDPDVLVRIGLAFVWAEAAALAAIAELTAWQLLEGRPGERSRVGLTGRSVRLPVANRRGEAREQSSADGSLSEISSSEIAVPAVTVSSERNAGAERHGRPPSCLSWEGLDDGF
jgi:hypothetical protein